MRTVSWRRIGNRRQPIKPTKPREALALFVLDLDAGEQRRFTVFFAMDVVAFDKPAIRDDPERPRQALSVTGDARTAREKPFRWMLGTLAHFGKGQPF